MNTIDFTLSIMIVLLAIGFGLEATKAVHEKTRDAFYAFEAKVAAEKCAALIDSFYANGGGKFIELETECHAKDEKIQATKNGFIKNSLSIAPAKKISANENGVVIEVEVEAHYAG
ncbi:MAG: hypothetical protein Q7K34_03800 [archaeon]|nr:hypothetical protein [archaeon]